MSSTAISRRRRHSLDSSRSTTLPRWRWVLRCGPPTRRIRRSEAQLRPCRITTALRRRSGLSRFPSRREVHLTAQLAPTASPGLPLEDGLLKSGLQQKHIEPGALLIQLSQPPTESAVWPPRAESPGTAAASGGSPAFVTCFEYVFSCMKTWIGDRLTRKIGLKHGVSISITAID